MNRKKNTHSDKPYVEVCIVTWHAHDWNASWIEPPDNESWYLIAKLFGCVQ